MVGGFCENCAVSHLTNTQSGGAEQRRSGWDLTTQTTGARQGSTWGLPFGLLQETVRASANERLGTDGPIPHSALDSVPALFTY